MLKTKQNLNGLNHHTEELKSIRDAANKADYIITKTIRKITKDVLKKSVDFEYKKNARGNAEIPFMILHGLSKVSKNKRVHTMSEIASNKLKKNQDLKNFMLDKLEIANEKLEEYNVEDLLLVLQICSEQGLQNAIEHILDPKLFQ